MPPVPGVRRAQTRARLVAAAAEVFAVRGFAGASVEEICERAGYTRGAFYGSFASKEEVFLALLDEHNAATLAAVRAEALAGRGSGFEHAAGPGGGDALDALVRAAARVTPEDRHWFLLSTEFTLHAVRHPDVALVLAEHDAAIRGAIAELVAAALRLAGRVATVELTALAGLIVALREGALTQACVDPVRVPPGSLEATFLPVLVQACSRPVAPAAAAG